MQHKVTPSIQQYSSIQTTASITENEVMLR